MPRGFILQRPIGRLGNQKIEQGGQGEMQFLAAEFNVASECIYRFTWCRVVADGARKNVHHQALIKPFHHCA